MHISNSITIQHDESDFTTLPFVPFSDVEKTIGEEIGDGAFGRAHYVKDSSPTRVYKITKFGDISSNESRICKIAGEIGVGPAFHRAFLTDTCWKGNKEEKCLFIEMDYAGRPLHKWRRALTKSGEEYLSEGKTIKRIYGEKELFYCDLFTKIKMLAERNIPYSDTNAGNIIMPEPGSSEGLKLIDFGGIRISKDCKEAATTVLESKTNQKWMQKFTKLPKLSDKSLELIKWFTGSQPDVGDKAPVIALTFKKADDVVTKDVEEKKVDQEFDDGQVARQLMEELDMAYARGLAAQLEREHQDEAYARRLQLQGEEDERGLKRQRELEDLDMAYAISLQDELSNKKPKK